MSKVFDVIIVGAGASGLACAYFLKTHNIVIFDKYEGARKLSITGNNRCNITNTLPYENFLEQYGKNGKFLRDTFNNFFRNELIEWLKTLGVETKTEKGRVILKNKSSGQLSKILKSAVEHKAAWLKKFEPALDIKKEQDIFLIKTQNGLYKSIMVVLTCGGMSFPKTGSDGSCYRLAVKFGHTITGLEPAETPFCTKPRLDSLKGITLSNIKATLTIQNKNISDKGDIIFTHFGVSGPLIFKLSSYSFQRATLRLELVKNSEKVIKKLHFYKGKVRNFLSQYIPARLSQMSPYSDEFAANLNKNQLNSIKKFLSGFTLEVSKCGFDRAFVTKGGVSLKEINPKTFESRLIKNLFFGGEILDIQGNIGGFNLQFAFSSGYTIAKSINERLLEMAT